MRPLLWLSQLGFKMEVKCNRAKLHEDRFTSLRQAPPWSTLNPDINAFFLYRALESSTTKRLTRLHACLLFLGQAVAA